MALLSSLIGAFGQPIVSGLVQRYMLAPYEAEQRQKLQRQQQVENPLAASQAFQPFFATDQPIWDPNTGQMNQQYLQRLLSAAPGYVAQTLHSGMAGPELMARANEQLGQAGYYNALTGKIPQMIPYEQAHLTGQAAAGLGSAAAHYAQAGQVGSPSYVVTQGPNGPVFTKAPTAGHVVPFHVGQYEGMANDPVWQAFLQGMMQGKGGKGQNPPLPPQAGKGAPMPPSSQPKQPTFSPTGKTLPDGSQIIQGSDGQYYKIPASQ